MFFKPGLVQVLSSNLTLFQQILVHGDECGHVNEQTIYTLLSDNNMLVKHGMKSIINRVDSSGNTALHYAKHYPNQDIVKFLLRSLKADGAFP